MGDISLEQIKNENVDLVSSLTSYDVVTLLSVYAANNGYCIVLNW